MIVEPTRQPGGEGGLDASLGAAVLHLLEEARASSGGSQGTGAVDAARRLATEGARLLPGSAAAILMPGPAERSFRVVATSGGPASTLDGQSWPRRGTIIQRAVERLGAVESEISDELHEVGPALLATGMGCVRVVPLVAEQAGNGAQAVGVYLAMREAGVGFSTHERRLLDAYAALVSMVLVNARQQIKEEAEARRLALGVDVALDLASALSPQDVNHRILVRTTDAVHADRATLMRLKRDDAVVEDFFDREGLPGATGMRIHLHDHPPILRTLTTRKVERVAGAPLEIPDAPAAWSKARQSVVLPLVFAGEVTGFLMLQRRRDDPFSDSDISMLQLISNLAVLALHNARLYADAQESRAAMSEFLDVVVHDLRSPLTVVGGYCSMMREGTFGPAKEAWRRPLEIVESKVREAQRLVDQLLTAARLDHGELPVHDQDVELCGVAREAVARAEPQAQLNGAHLTLKVGEEEIWARGDRANLDQIVDNLVNNALAYGGAPAEVEVAVVDHGSPGIAVSDHGPGIPADNRERIFDRFFRGHQGVQGTGLGLYVSRRLAAASHGKLELDAGWTRGSRFVLSLVAAGR